MTTPAQERLAALFGSDRLPTPPPADTKTFAGKELEVQMAGQSSWKIPDQAEYPRKHNGPTPKPADNTELLTSSDGDDDYVAAFSKKPKMKPAERSKSGRHTETPKGPSRWTRKNAEDSKANKDSLTRLPVVDKHSNPAVGHFCSFGLVARFPYKYIDDSNGRVSRHFFANGKIYTRTWDLYYLHGPESSLLQPLVLVPYDQVERLIDEIGTKFKIEIAVPTFPFTLTFFDDKTPQPVFLGRCSCRADINEMQGSIPAASPDHGEPPTDADVQVQNLFAAYKDKFEHAQQANKRKSNNAKKKKAADRGVQIVASCRSLTRAERYLGLYPAPLKLAEPDASMSWDEQAAFYAQQAYHTNPKLDPLDITKPAPFPFNHLPVYVCVDVESYERAHNIITEVGVSTLDTMDLVDLSPGQNGENWRKQIRSRHFRVQEYSGYRNKDFCIGDPEAFQFGESEFVSLKDIGEKVDSCFEYPFSVAFKHDGRLKIEAQGSDKMTSKLDSLNLQETGSDDAPSTNNSSSESGTQQKGPKERTVLIVGHGINSDLIYLSKLNSSIFASKSAPVLSADSHAAEDKPDSDLRDRAARGAKALDSIKESLDTAELYKVMMRDQNPRSLAGLLYDLEIAGFYLHNGGNDARYTLEALVAMTIKARQIDDEASTGKTAEASAEAKNPNFEESGPQERTSSRLEAEREKRISNRVEQARREAEKEFDAYDAAFAEDRAKADESLIPFSQTLFSTHAALEKKQLPKTSTQKNQELEMELREKGLANGPCDWAIGG